MIIYKRFLESRIDIFIYVECKSHLDYIDLFIDSYWSFLHIPYEKYRIAKKVRSLSLIPELRFCSDEGNDVKYFHRQASTLTRF